MPKYSKFFPIFSSNSFSVSGLMWIYLIHLHLSFVQRDKKGSIFILLHAECQLDEYHLLNRLSFFHWIFTGPWSKFRWPYIWGLITGSSILFHWSMCLFLYQSHTVFIRIALYYSLRSGIEILEDVYLFLRMDFAFLSLLLFQVKSHISLSNSMKNYIRILMGISLNL